MPWLAALPLVLLPIVPVAFAVVASLIGLWAWLVRREQPVWLWAFVAYAVLGVVSQGLVGLGLERDQSRSLGTLQALGVPLRTGGPANLFRSVTLASIHVRLSRKRIEHFFLRSLCRLLCRGAAGVSSVPRCSKSTTLEWPDAMARRASLGPLTHCSGCLRCGGFVDRPLGMAG